MRGEGRKEEENGQEGRENKMTRELGFERVSQRKPEKNDTKHWGTNLSID